jgi:hypothetical protein
MIGFRPPKTLRRPIYSVTGQKLCYLVSGPDGEWIYTLAGRKYAKITAKHREWMGKLNATASACGGAMLYPEELYEQ